MKKGKIIASAILKILGNSSQVQEGIKTKTKTYTKYTKERKKGMVPKYKKERKKGIVPKCKKENLFHPVIVEEKDFPVLRSCHCGRKKGIVPKCKKEQKPKPIPSTRRKIVPKSKKENLFHSCHCGRKKGIVPKYKKEYEFLFWNRKNIPFPFHPVIVDTFQ